MKLFVAALFLLAFCNSALADEKMSQAIEQLQNMPEMNELMQQLQKGGEELSPEMQQQLEKLQKMLQQLEQ